MRALTRFALAINSLNAEFDWWLAGAWELKKLTPAGTRQGGNDEKCLSLPTTYLPTQPVKRKDSHSTMKKTIMYYSKSVMQIQKSTSLYFCTIEYMISMTVLKWVSHDSTVIYFRVTVIYCCVHTY